MVSTLEKRINILTQHISVGSNKVIADMAKIKKESERMRGIKGGKPAEIAAAKQQLTTNKEALAFTQRKVAVEKIGLGIMQRQAKATGRFKMEYLGIMFAGMAMQRYSIGFLRDSINMYNKITGESNDFLKVTNKLSAAWAFFRYRLIDVLATSPAFKWMIDAIAKFVDKLSGISDAGIMALVVAIGSAVIAGTLLFGLGMVVLGVSSIITALTNLGIIGTAQVGKVGGMGVGGLGWLAKIAGAGIIVYLLWDIMGRGNTPLTTELFVQDLGLATIAGYMLGGPLGALAGFLIMLTFDVAKEGARKKVEDVNNMFAKEAHLRTPEEAYATGYQGTIVPQWVQDDATEQMNIFNTGFSNLDDMWSSSNMVNINPFKKMDTSIGTINPHINTMTTNLGLLDDAVVKLDENIETKSLRPDMDKLLLVIIGFLEPMLRLIDLTMSLTEKTIAATAAHYGNAEAMSAEASAARELASALSELGGRSDGGGRNVSSTRTQRV